jgi:hypothetical protein
MLSKCFICFELYDRIELNLINRPLNLKIVFELYDYVEIYAAS